MTAIEVDHVFICCEAGAPEAEALIRLGLREGSPNTHPGQGTANRRFFFDNFFLELIWVHSPEEARREATRRTRLWDRWSAHASSACPFGVIFRSKDAPLSTAPFPTWQYRPAYVPPNLCIELGEGTSLEEPELFFLPSFLRAGPPPNQPLDHALPIRRIQRVAIGMPPGVALSAATRIASKEGSVRFFTSERYLLELACLAEREATYDLRPALPLILRLTVA